MNNLNPLLDAVRLCFVLLALLACPPLAARTNIVLILCDDMGYSDIGCYGGEIRTPNLDRLAKEGMRFTQFYNCAKCNTTRASILTGLHPRFRAGLNRSMVTIGEVLGEAGYRSALSGKWHLGRGKDQHPMERGFDRYWGLLDGCCNFFNPVQRDPAFKGARVRTFGDGRKYVKSFPEDFYMTDAITDHAVESIREFARGDAPFLVHVCYTAPHYPLHAKPEDIARYKERYLGGWEKLRDERYERMVSMGLVDPKWKRPGRETRVGPWEKEKNKEWQALRMAVYSAMIDSMDQGIGRILKALDDSKVADETLVLFLSDNGACSEQFPDDRPAIEPGPKENYTACGPAWAWAQNTPFRRYKAWTQEGGIATPLIARWPGKVKAGAVTAEVGHIIDFLPTFAEIAGARYPETYKGKDIIKLEGISLLPVLKGGSRKGHDVLCWYWGGSHAARQGSWKLVWEKTEKRWALYDLEKDRTETRDLSGQYPQKVDLLKAAYEEWRKRTGAPAPRGPKKKAGKK
ncbi:MAG: arylsulfatase [Planctomycetota bacterium]|nr:arylsulfatase [Planctomycetota bacterium]